MNRLIGTGSSGSLFTWRRSSEVAEHRVRDLSYSRLKSVDGLSVEACSYTDRLSNLTE